MWHVFSRWSQFQHEKESIVPKPELGFLKTKLEVRTLILSSIFGLMPWTILRKHFNLCHICDTYRISTQKFFETINQNSNLKYWMINTQIFTLSNLLIETSKGDQKQTKTLISLTLLWKTLAQNSCKGNGVSSVHSIATQLGRPRFFTCPFNTRYSIYERYYCRRARVFMSQDLWSLVMPCKLTPT